ncbi:MAG: MBL fold metallo-hydrolase [Chloroflexi bacterium]|nr:MBL fold metallo-hydrolase [Chloroflexota bacterium]
MAVYVRECRLLFTGDTILGSGTPVVSADHGDMALYLQTLRRFLDYDLALICPGHGPVVQDPRTRVAGVIQHRLEREEQIMTAIGRGRHTLDQLLEAVYPVLDARLHRHARSQIRCHLIKLEREGRVQLCTK